jgi:hypothetical protein
MSRTATPSSSIACHDVPGGADSRANRKATGGRRSVSLAAAMTAALVARGVPEITAHLAGELGVLAFKQGYPRWTEQEPDGGHGLAEHALAALDELRTAFRSLD